MTELHSSPPPLGPWPADLAAAVLQATPDLLLTLSEAGRIQHANAAALHALQMHVEELVGSRFLDLLDTGSQAKGQRLLEEAFSGKPGQVYELNHVAGDGQIVMVGYRVVPLKRLGTPLLLVGQPTATTVAVTERLIALNRRLSALFTLAASASRSLVLHELLDGALGVIRSELKLQAAAIFLTDLPVDAHRTRAVPRSPRQLQLAVQQGFTPTFVDKLANLEQLTAFWNPAIENERVSVVQGTADEAGIDPADLEYMTGPLLTVAATPLMSETRLLGWLYVVTDRYNALPPDALDLLQTVGNLLGPPVENARLYDALRETSSRLAAVLDSIDSGVLLRDESGIVRYANARLGALVEVDVTQWRGHPRADLMPTTLQPLKQSEHLFDGQLWVVVGATPRVLRRFAQHVTDQDGTPLGSIEVYSDVTQLHRTNQLRDEFVAAAAHDLKTPVTAIKGYAQIALRLARTLEEPRLVQQLAMINARSDDLARLMDSLLDMSRIQAGRLQLDLTTLTVQDLVGHVMKHFDFDLHRRQRSIVRDLPADPLDVEWDRHRMEGVLINLIGNALKYSPEGGDVIVRVRHIPDAPQLGNDAVELAVTDYGIGIPVAERENIFDRFYRVREAVEHGFRGTGIGLYTSHSIVKAHGGRIWAADAIHGGRGTTVFIRMPRRAQPDRAMDNHSTEAGG